MQPVANAVESLTACKLLISLEWLKGTEPFHDIVIIFRYFKNVFITFANDCYVCNLYFVTYIIE